MTANSGRAIEIFTEAIQLPTEERAAFLDRACANDEELRRKIEALLKTNDRAAGFLEQPAATILKGAVKAMPGEKPGDQIDRYKLLEQIGEGGCGIVFRAEQEKPVRRLVAMKILKPGMDTKSVIARFEAERQALALMDHPNIAHVFDAGATGSGRPYFVMELVAGLKMTDYCDRHSLPTGARLELFVQVCDAIQHAHQKGIIHRDIKPSNILVTTAPDGKPMPKVIDFGIAKATDGHRLTDETIFTAQEMLMGTPAYMSPEQAALAGAEVDTRTDIYSLGVLLYELLTGTTPFDARELLKSGFDEIRRVVREVEPVRPSTRLTTMSGADFTQVCEHRHAEPSGLIRQLRGDLDWIVMMALEKDRTRRYKTANGLSLDVQRFLSGRTVSARPPSKLYQLRKSLLRHKLLYSAIGAIAVLLVVSLVIVSVSLAKERQARRDAEAASVKSQQETRFLEDAFRGVAPSVALGQDTTMLRGILDQSSVRVGTEMTNQPAVEADLRNLFGTLYWQIGNYGRAEEMQRSALEIRRNLFGSNDPRVAESLNDLGLELQREGKLTEAERAVGEALAIRQHLFSRTNVATATSLNDLGAIYRDEGRLTEAEVLAREALAIRQGLFGQTNLDVADSLRNLSIILGGQAKWAESEATARKVLAMQRQILGPEHPFVASTLNDVAWAAANQGKSEEAERLQEEALEIREKLLPAEDPAVAESLRLAGNSLRKTGNSKVAFSVLSGVLSIQNKVLGKDDPSSIDTLQNLAAMLGDQGNWSEAETLYRRALDLCRKHSGDESKLTLDGITDLGLALENQSKWPEAATLYRDALTLSRKIWGADDQHTLFFMHRLGLTFEGEGKWADAESMHREALALWRKRAGYGDVQTLYAMQNLAASLAGAGKWPQAESVDREALALWRKQPGKVDSDILFTLDRLDSTLEAQQKWTEAESAVREMLALQKERAGNLDPATLYTMHRLGLTLEGEGKWADAESMHREALALWRTKKGENAPESSYAMRNLAEAFEREGKLGEAENLYREEMASWRQQAGDEDQQTFYSRRKLGLTLEAEHKWPEAETVFRESLALARKRAGAEGPEALADLERLVRVLLPQKKFSEADHLLGEVLTPAFIRQPAAANLMNQRVNLMGRQKRWLEAATNATIALELQPTDHYRFHTLAGLLAITGDRPAYEQLCKRILASFVSTTNCFVAERMAQDCLLLPHSGADLKVVDKLADTAVTVGSNNPSLDYFQACKALSDYRLGQFHEAIEWAEKSARGPDPEAQAKAFAIVAMANWQIGQKDAARTALAKEDAFASHLSPQADAADLGESWVAWLMALIQLNEAAELINPVSSAMDELNAAPLNR